jgi:hypothetical protein
MALYLTFGRPNEATYAYEMAGRRNHGPLTVDLDDTVKTKLALWNIETIEDEMTQQVMK